MNPCKQIRLSFGISQQELAERAGVARLTVIDTESGLFTKIPPSLMRVLSRISGLASVEIADKYTNFLRQNRRANAEEFAVSLIGIETFDDYSFAVGASARGFARVLLVQPSIIREYISKGYRWEMIEAALKDAGVPAEFVEFLSKLPPSTEVPVGGKRSRKRAKTP